MKRYCLGFLFDFPKKKVTLIHKLHPKWQAGRWNGIGGKLKESETAQEGMVREFEEETGVATRINDWKQFAAMTDEASWRCNCFVACDTVYQGKVAHVEEEEPGIFNVKELPHVIENVPILIQLALLYPSPRFTYFHYNNPKLIGTDDERLETLEQELKILKDKVHDIDNTLDDLIPPVEENLGISVYRAPPTWSKEEYEKQLKKLGCQSFKDMFMGNPPVDTDPPMGKSVAVQTERQRQKMISFGERYGSSHFGVDPAKKDDDND